MIQLVNKNHGVIYDDDLNRINFTCNTIGGILKPLMRMIEASNHLDEIIHLTKEGQEDSFENIFSDLLLKNEKDD